MAPDGTGGVTWVKAVNGVPHVFASRYVEGSWSPPIQVDSTGKYEAGQPRIAAGASGELLAVWVTPVATVKGKLQFALMSARLAAGAETFSRPLVVDPNVGEGIGVAPSLAGTSPGKAIVAYRAITFSFRVGAPNTTGAVQLRPGDVMAEIRVARLSGDRWSRLGPANRNVEASTRPPTATNGPQIGIGIEGGAVIAWQEPDQTAAARIWMRRVFGSSFGPPLQVSPSTWEGAPVSADADAFSLSVTPYAGAQVAYRVANLAGTPLAGRVLVNSLPPLFDTAAKELTGSRIADGGSSAVGLGAPSIAGAETANKRPTARLGIVAGSRPRLLGGEGTAALGLLAIGAATEAQPNAEAAVTVGPAGGGVLAYPALAGGLSTLAVRQELSGGAVQSALVSGAAGGPISGLTSGRSGLGDALLGFRQGEAGEYEIVADAVSVPPEPFNLKAPKKWVKPGAAVLNWEAPPTAVGGLSYAVLIDGATVQQGLRRHRSHLPAVRIGNGVLRAQVLATDALGGQVTSETAMLKVDGRPPTVSVKAGGAKVRVRLRDSGSGVKPAATKISYGDGKVRHGGSAASHVYDAPGSYRVVVVGADKVGNRVHRGFEVRVR
jgi:hypothetical protein